MAFVSGGFDLVFLLARVLFGVVLAFMGLNHFLNVDQMTPYADAKGIPMPKASVLASGAVLVLGGLSVATGAFPVVGAALLAVFFVVTTPTMHDFWAAPEEDAQDEMTHFLKNVALLGGSLAFLAVGSLDWPYALNVGPF